MSTWNYVVTAHKPTSVTHSCVGSFTDRNQTNLIIAKCTRIEIHLFTDQGLEAITDLPIYGRIATLELFRPQGEIKDLLFITTDRYKLCILEWDSVASKVITRETRDVSDPTGLCTPAKNGQISIIDPHCRYIGLYLYDGLFKVIPFDWGCKLKKTINTRFEVNQVWDIKFLHGFDMPTIAVLYQDKKNVRRLKTYELVSRSQKFSEVPWDENLRLHRAYLLIPVPYPLCGVLIIGEETIVHSSGSTCTEIRVRPSITRAYSTIYADFSRYLLGDHDGVLHLLSLTHGTTKVTGLIITQLGETSIALSISCLRKDIFFVGSSSGDSQLIKLDTKRSCVGVLDHHVNLGPIVDFCVVDLERQGQGQIVTCSGTGKDSSLRIVQHGIRINEQQASLNLQGIKGLWPLRSATDAPYDTFLVISFINETRILAMDIEDELEETEIEGFCSQVQTLFCHDAVFDQIVQVTSNSVRLVKSTSQMLLKVWVAPEGSSVNVATANATQVLLALGGGQLVYLEIGDGVLTTVQRTKLEYDISCLDINPIGDDPNRSQLAAVGTWDDISVWIYSLPELNLMKKEPLGGTIIPRSVLMCSFEGISYLLCALGDGCLFTFVLKTSMGELVELADKKRRFIGTQPVTLRTFSSKHGAHVFAASDWPTVIYSSNKKLHYRNVNLNEVSYMCPFNPDAFPYSLVIAKGVLTFGTINETEELHARSIPLGGEHARRICHQEQTRTFAICSSQANQIGAGDKEKHFIRLLDAQTFKFTSLFALDPFERGCSILSCSFSDDMNVYYCVGTAFFRPKALEPSSGRILVFVVKDGKFVLVAKEETRGAVFSLNAFNGKLLVGVNMKIQLYNWKLHDDNTGELQSECEHNGRILAIYVQTKDNTITVFDLRRSSYLLFYNPNQQRAFTEDFKNKDCYEYDNTCWMSAYMFLEGNCYIRAENYSIFIDLPTTYRHYHLGEFINGFRHGSSIVMHDPKMGRIPTVIFGTSNGAIGVVASLPPGQYDFLWKLQKHLRKVVMGVGILSHEQWRQKSQMLDGDLIESFLDLPGNQMDEIATELKKKVDELRELVEGLRRLH